MNVHSLEYPQQGEDYLKEIINIQYSGLECHMGTVFLPKGSRIPDKGLKSHPFHEISVIMEGSLKAITNDKEVVLKKGDIITLDFNEMHAAEVIENCKILWVLFG